MAKIIIYGSSVTAEQCAYDFTTDSEHEVVAFTLHRKEIKENEFLRLPVVPFEDIEKIYPPSDYSMFVSIFFKQINLARKLVFEEAKNKGYKLVSYVSSRAIVWPGLVIGENVMIADGANIRPKTKIGDGVFIFPNAVIGHECVVEDFAYIAIAAVMIAGSIAKERCIIGANATILSGVTIGRECLISAGALVNRDTKDKGVYTIDQQLKLQPVTSDRLGNVIFKQPQT
jgi:sugar O-acyltransferase (sialic acid O-acetyltransferase NeuD family)